MKYLDSKGSCGFGIYLSIVQEHIVDASYKDQRNTSSLLTFQKRIAAEISSGSPSLQRTSDDFVAQNID